MRTLLSLVALSGPFLLGACGDGGGGGGSSLKLSAIDGTWRIESTVTNSTGCATVGAREVTYANFANTSGTVVEVTDAEEPIPVVLTAEAAGRSVLWTGSGADAGDSFTLTLNDGDLTLAGTVVEFDESVSPTCTTTFSVVGTKVVGAAAVAAGNWEFQVTLANSAGTFTFVDVALQQRFASIQATNATMQMGGVLAGGALDASLQATEGAGLAVDVTGSFTSSKAFTGSCSGTLGSAAVDGSITGRWVSGGGDCTGVDTSRRWNIVISTGPLFTGAPIVFENCTAEKVGCDVTFTWDSSRQFPYVPPAQTVVFTGTIIDNNVYRPTVSGTYFAERYSGATFTFDGTFVGSLSRKWTGTYNATGVPAGSGSIVFQRR